MSNSLLKSWNTQSTSIVSLSLSLLEANSLINNINSTKFPIHKTKQWIQLLQIGITLSSGKERRATRLAKAPESSTARTPASKPQAKLPSAAADWTSRSACAWAWAWASARAQETAGTAPSLRKKSFLVRLPMIWFLSSLRALSLISESAEPIRTMRSDEARRWLDEAEADAEGEAGVGMVSELRSEFHASSRRKKALGFSQRDREREMGIFEFLNFFFFVCLLNKKN